MRVLVADRQPLFRRGVVDVMASEPDLEVVGETDEGTDVADLVERLRVDVVLLDLAVPGGGVEACALLRATRPDVRVVVLTSIALDHMDVLGDGIPPADYMRTEQSPQWGKYVVNAPQIMRSQ